MSRAPRAITFRILAAFLICIGMFIGALSYSLVQLSNIGEQLQILSMTYQPVSEVSAQLNNVARQIDRQHDGITDDATGPQEGHLYRAQRFSDSLQVQLEHGEDILNETQGWLQAEQERESIDGMLTDLDVIDDANVEYFDRFNAWTRAAPEDQQRAYSDLDEQWVFLRMLIFDFSNRVTDRIDEIGETTSRAQERAYSLGGALALSAILLGALLAGVALYTLKPIGELTHQVQRLAAGDYTGRVDVGGQDEMGLLAREINTLAEAVQERDRILVERAEALDQLSLRLRRILDTIQAGLIVIHGKHAETVNPAATRLWGLGEGDTLPSDLIQLEIGSHRGTSIGSRIFDLEVVPFGGDGRLLVGEDVTERIAAQDRLARSERLALVGRMLAQITHEVRNPLNAMSLNAELLTEDLAESPHQEIVETITREIHRLDQLTGRYLELSRGRRSELNPVDPLELIRDVLKAESQALQRSGLEISMEGESPGVVEVDTDALRRAFLNLLRNATEAGASHVQVLLKSHSDRLLVEVKDNGPGMDTDQVQRVFEPFYTTKATGTGLGLAISRQELEEVGGSLNASSEPDEGSCFLLEIPIRSN